MISTQPSVIEIVGFSFREAEGYYFIASVRSLVFNLKLRYEFAIDLLQMLLWSILNTLKHIRIVEKFPYSLIELKKMRRTYKGLRFQR